MIRCLNASSKEIFYTIKDQSYMVNRVDLYAKEGARYLRQTISLSESSAAV